MDFIVRGCGMGSGEGHESPSKYEGVGALLFEIQLSSEFSENES